MLGVHVGRVIAPGLVTRGGAWLRARVPPLRGLRKTAAAARSMNTELERIALLAQRRRS